jgi:hypothetical protein
MEDLTVDTRTIACKDNFPKNVKLEFRYLLAITTKIKQDTGLWYRYLGRVSDDSACK